MTSTVKLMKCSEYKLDTDYSSPFCLIRNQRKQVKFCVFVPAHSELNISLVIDSKFFFQKYMTTGLLSSTDCVISEEL